MTRERPWENLPASFTGMSSPPPQRSGLFAALCLSPRQWQILRLSWVKKFNTVKIARKLRISCGTVRSHRSRAYRVLAESMRYGHG